jgi:hypothetical protein
MEYNRAYTDAPTKFGTSKVAVAGGDDDPYEVIPQDSGNSYLLFSFNLQAL